jgi:hypothetical protein
VLNATIELTRRGTHRSEKQNKALGGKNVFPAKTGKFPKKNLDKPVMALLACGGGGVWRLSEIANRAILPDSGTQWNLPK